MGSGQGTLTVLKYLLVYKLKCAGAPSFIKKYYYLFSENYQVNQESVLRKQWRDIRSLKIIDKHCTSDF